MTTGQIQKTLINCVLGALACIVINSLPLCESRFQAIGAAFLILGTNKGTNRDQEKEGEDAFFGMDKDNKTDLPYRPAVLRDRGGDLKKWWYVEFYAFDEKEGELVRKRKKIPMTFVDKKSRTRAGNELIAKINSLLKKGFHFKVRKSSINTKSATSDTYIVAALNDIIEITSPEIAPKTILTYQSAVNKLETYLSGQKVKISEFDNKSVINFRDYLITSLQNNSRTANNTIQHLAAVYSKLEKRSTLPNNPFKTKSLREAPSTKNVAFTKEDQLIIEDYLKKHEPRVYFMSRLIYYAFLRPGELMKLRLFSINLKDNYITVSGTISKSGNTETTQIIPPLRESISNYLDLNKFPPGMLLFGKDLVPGMETVGKQVAFRRHEKALKKLGLLNKGYTLYSWKHTGAVNAYLAGVGIKELQRMLRHSNVQITDIYLRSLGLRTDPNVDSYSW